MPMAGPSSFRLAAPGDVVRIQIDRTRGNVAFASIIEIIKPSAVRVEPPCPYFGRCGGCDFQQLDYQAQLKAKVEIIRDCLHRIAQVELPADIEIHPSPNSGIIAPVRTGKLIRKPKRSAISSAVLIRFVMLQSAPYWFRSCRRRWRNCAPGLGPIHFLGKINSIEAAAGAEGVSLAPGWAGFPTKNVSRQIGEHKYYFNAEAFFQVNPELLAPLIDAALGNARGAIAIDLYCGAGLFTVPLACLFEKVIGVESNPVAAKFALVSLKNSRLSNARIVTAHVGEWLSNQQQESQPIDFLLLDPPRAGAENRVIRGILGLRPRHISYVSCDPATLARDLKKLLAGGYTLESVTALDMFPQTHHVETVVHLGDEKPLAES